MMRASEIYFSAAAAEFIVLSLEANVSLVIRLKNRFPLLWDDWDSITGGSTTRSVKFFPGRCRRHRVRERGVELYSNFMHTRNKNSFQPSSREKCLGTWEFYLAERIRCVWVLVRVIISIHQEIFCHRRLLHFIFFLRAWNTTIIDRRGAKKVDKCLLNNWTT